MLRLIEKNCWQYTLKLTSAFSSASLLKARIEMLYARPSVHGAYAKFGFAVHTLALCLLITALNNLPASAYSLDDYMLLTSHEVPSSGRKMPYIFKKGNHYMYRLIDAKSKALVKQDVIKVKIALKDSKIYIPLTQTENGQEFSVEDTGLYEVTFENPEWAIGINANLYFSQTKKVGKFLEGTDIVLADMAGEEVNFKKKISIKKGLQILMEAPLKTEEYQFKKVEIHIFHKNKEVSKRTLETNKLTFEGLNIKHGDAIQLSILEVMLPNASGTLEKVYIKRPFITFFVK